VLQNDL